jgi:hypothetical protein
MQQVHKVDNLTSLSRLSKQCGVLNISQPYRPPLPVMGTALFFYVFVPHRKHTYRPPWPVTVTALLFYM